MSITFSLGFKPMTKKNLVQFRFTQWPLKKKLFITRTSKVKQMMFYWVWYQRWGKSNLTWSRFLKNCIVILSSIWYSWIRAVKRWRTLISSLMIWSFCPLVLPFRDSNSAVLRWRSISSWAFCYKKTNITPLSRICLKVIGYIHLFKISTSCKFMKY